MVKTGDNKIKFLILIEKSEQNYSAYAPDLPGCVAAGETKEKIIGLMKKAIENHLQLMKESHLRNACATLRNFLTNVTAVSV